MTLVVVNVFFQVQCVSIIHSVLIHIHIREEPVPAPTAPPVPGAQGRAGAASGVRASATVVSAALAALRTHGPARMGLNHPGLAGTDITWISGKLRYHLDFREIKISPGFQGN